MIAKAQGQLRHRFWGTYSALIVIAFKDTYTAKASLPFLGDGWHVSEGQPHVLFWSGEQEALEKCKEVLVSFGADASKIDSVAKSIDYGEPFTIEVPGIVPEEQGNLF